MPLFSLVALLSQPAEAFQQSSASVLLDTAYQPMAQPAHYKYSLVDDAEGGESSGDGDGDLKRTYPRTKQKYSHPGFTIPQRASIVGGVSMIGGGVTVLVGGAIALVGVIPAAVGNETIYNTGTTVMWVGAAAFTLGGLTMTVGSITAGVVLRRLDHDVPFTGLFIAAGGLAAAVGASSVPETDASAAVRGYGMLAVPAGIVTQIIINGVHYNRYIESLAVTPTFSRDSIGAVAQWTF